MVELVLSPRKVLKHPSPYRSRICHGIFWVPFICLGNFVEGESPVGLWGQGFREMVRDLHLFLGPPRNRLGSSMNVKSFGAIAGPSADVF